MSEKLSLSRLMGMRRDRKSYKEDSVFVLPDTFMGVEFEFEGVSRGDHQLPINVNPDLDLWEYHEDGSLRDSGAEFVFAEPYFGADAKRAIDSLLKHATKQKWQISKRTGLHVHVDIRDIGLMQLQGMLLLYAMFEKAIFNFVGDGREYSIFCVPWYRSDDAIKRAASILRGAMKDAEAPDNAVGHARMAASHYERYAGINLESLSKYGSVEFRHLKTTLDSNRIYTWINILLSLKAAGARVPASDGALIRQARSADAVEFGNYVFGPELMRVLYYPGFREDFRMYGVPNALDLVRLGVEPVVQTELAYGVDIFPKGDNRQLNECIKKYFTMPDTAPAPEEDMDPGDRAPGSPHFVGLGAPHWDGAARRVHPPLGAVFNNRRERRAYIQFWIGGTEGLTDAEIDRMLPPAAAPRFVDAPIADTPALRTWTTTATVTTTAPPTFTQEERDQLLNRVFRTTTARNGTRNQR